MHHGNISRLKQVLVANKGDSDVYLNVVCGTESKMMILGEHLRGESVGEPHGGFKGDHGAGNPRLVCFSTSKCGNSHPE